MAMTKAGLKAAIQTKLGVSNSDTAGLDQLDKIADAIVSYIQANAVVSITILPDGTVNAATGTGPAIVSGSATGTIT